MQFLAATFTLRVHCLHATPNPLVSNARPWPGERPDDGKRGGLQRTLRLLAAGAGLAALALLGARYVLRARRPQNETPLERARRELRDLRRRIEVRAGSVARALNASATLGVRVAVPAQCSCMCQCTPHAIAICLEGLVSVPDTTMCISRRVCV